MGDFALHGLVPASAAPAGDESCFVSAINSARASAGVAPLGPNAAMLSTARSWSQTMADAGSIFHNTNLADVAPSTWQAISENARVRPPPGALAPASMNSPQHRHNLLD